MIYFDILDGTDIAVLLTRPNWGSSVDLEAYLITTISPVLEGQEDREAMNDRLRYRLRWMGMLETGQLTDFFLGMSRLKTQPVVCPFWPEEEVVVSIASSVVTIDGTWGFTADRIIIYDRLGNYEIIAANRGAQTANTITLTAPPAGSWSGEYFIAPLFKGVMKQRPTRKGLTDDAAAIELNIEDMAAYDRALLPIGGSIAYGGSMTPDFTTKPVFPFYPDFSDPVSDDQLSVSYSGMGFLREEQIAYYDALPKRGDEMRFSFDTKEQSAAFLAFFVTQLGPVKPFFLPTHRGELRLTRNTASGSASIYCEKNDRYHAEFNSVDKHPGTDFLALVSPTSIRVVQVDATAIVGNEIVLTAHENIGEVFSYTGSKVCALHLSRFADTSIRVSFITNRVSDMQVRFLECAEEYLTLADTGASTTKGWLYKFYTDIPGYTVWRYTSFERSLTNTDGTYTPSPFEHGGLRGSLNLDVSEATIRSFKFTGNPLQQLIPYSMEMPLKVDIYECEASDPNDLTLLFRGKVRAPRVRGQVIEAKAVALGGASDRKIPWFLFQRACNHDVFCAETCGIDPDDHVVNGGITALNAGAYWVEVGSLDNSGGTRADQYFAQGWIETGTGAGKEYRSILRSELQGGGVQRLYLNRALVYASVSQAVQFWPGCDKSYTGANGCPKFGSGFEVRFGGFPGMPEVNPSIEAVPLEPGDARRK